MSRSDHLTVHLLEQLAPIGPLAARRMFGGVGLFYGEIMFGLIAREELFFKAGDSNRADYEKAEQRPFSYETKNGVHTIGSYWRCPPELLDDPEALRGWAAKAVKAAVEAARAKPRSPRPAKRRRRS